MNAPVSEQCLRGQVHRVQPQLFGRNHQAFAHVVAPAEQPQPHPQPGMFVEQHARFQLPLAPDQDGSAPSVLVCICSNKVFRLGGEIIFLPTPASKLPNLG